MCGLGCADVYSWSCRASASESNGKLERRSGSMVEAEVAAAAVVCAEEVLQNRSMGVGPRGPRPRHAFANIFVALRNVKPLKIHDLTEPVLLST